MTHLFDLTVLTFGSFEGEPFVFRPGEAWVVREGASSWSRTCSAEIGMGGRVLSKAAFDAKFPSLPPLPIAIGPRRSAGTI